MRRIIKMTIFDDMEPWEWNPYEYDEYESRNTNQKEK